MSDIAVLLTCFNRREKTLLCLQRLIELAPTASVYLVDDGSTDGTATAVADAFPDVIVIEGTGNLFWNRGMRLAWQRASLKNHEIYVWLNDDVILARDAIIELLQCYSITREAAVVSGLVSSHDGLTILYGGTNSSKQLLQPNGTLQSITNMNGNIVLVPRHVFERLGYLDHRYIHDLGDVDYGLRAQAAGIEVLTTRKAIGTCDRNELCRVRAPKTRVVNRFRKLYSPLGSNPIIGFHFRKRHYGLANATLYFIYVHVLNLIPDSLTKLLFGTRYIRE